MKKTLPLAALFILAAQSPNTTDSLYNKVVAFEMNWDIFIRKLAGCPLGVVLTESGQCNPNRGVLDRAAYARARKAAAKLFELEEKRFE